MHLDATMQNLLRFHGCVLILIVMEYALRYCTGFAKDTETGRLNPYCNGICT